MGEIRLKLEYKLDIIDMENAMYSVPNIPNPITDLIQDLYNAVIELQDIVSKVKQ